MKSLITLCLLASALPANAALIATNTTEITTTAQTYEQAFVLGGTSYSDVVLSLTAKGDFGWSTGSEFETIDFFIDGQNVAHWINHHDDTVAGEPAVNVTPGISIVENLYEFDYTLSADIFISAADWDIFSADNEIIISWANGINVDAYAVDGGADFVSYSLAGNISAVPVPAAVWLFGTGLVGLAGVARRNSRA